LLASHCRICLKSRFPGGDSFWVEITKGYQSRTFGCICLFEKSRTATADTDSGDSNRGV
jgi:hypothetical protein